MSRAAQAQDAAVRWIVAQEEPDWTEADQAQFDAWLAESVLNRVTYLRLEHSWREADRIGSLGPALMPKTLRGDRRLRHKMKLWLPLAAAASLIIAIALGLQVNPAKPTVEVVKAKYDTGIGGHKSIDLPDGSKVELSTRSVVRTAVGDTGRVVWLDRGEAYFEVAHDKSKPFVVYAGNRRVVVLGTKFSVRRNGDEVTVVVREGSVRVDDIQNPEAIRSTTITAGEIALTQNPGILVTAKSEERVENALAWRDGLLRLDQDPLSEVVAEFNRHNRQQLVVTDAEAASIRIGGIFPASRPADFARLLRDAYGLKIEETPETIRISS